jgi:hypothetical protein
MIVYQWSNLVGDKGVDQSVVVVDAGLVDLISSTRWQNPRPGKRKSIETHLKSIFFLI